MMMLLPFLTNYFLIPGSLHRRGKRDDVKPFVRQPGRQCKPCFALWLLTPRVADNGRRLSTAIVLQRYGKSPHQSLNLGKNNKI
ncbi:MAG: hypothetical protein SPI30_00860 [Prevotella sp.]|nr:hypothetical protein [Prevotella sp.]